MNRGFHKKYIGVLIVITLISGQLILPLQASAGNKYLNWDNPNSGGSNQFKITPSQLGINSQTAMQVVGCTGIVNKLLDAATDFATRLLAGESLKSIFGGEVDTKNQTEAQKLDAAKKKQDATEKRQACFDGIAIRLAKNQLTAMTKSTLNWVNTGFNGDPLFVDNVNKFMGDIQKDLLDKELNLFKDPKNKDLYPYGRGFAQDQVNSYKVGQDPETALQQDLTNHLSPGASPDSFGKDFSQGGWDGWLALTQKPQNNPLGFTLTAKENIAKKTEKEITTQQKEIDQNQGFHSDKRCTEFALSKNSQIANKRLQDRADAAMKARAETLYAKNKADEAQKAAAAAQKEYEDAKKTADTIKATQLHDKWAGLAQVASQLNAEYKDIDAREAANNANIAKEKADLAAKANNDQECTSWEVITPGSIIKDKVTKAINSPETQLELTRTINDGLNGLFESFFNQFESQGLTGLSTPITKFTNSSDPKLNNAIKDTTGTVATVYTSGSTGGNGSEGSFDITKDLGNKYIDPVSDGTWDAKANTTTNVNSPILVAGIGDKNHYYTVSVAGDTNILSTGTHHWNKGEKAFFDGTVWKVGLPKHIIDKKGVIQVQYDYNNQVRESLQILPKVMPAIGELDYCIPGPNPNWKSNTDDTRNAYLEYIQGATVDSNHDQPSVLGINVGPGTTSFSVKSDFSSYKNLFEPTDWTAITQQSFFSFATTHGGLAGAGDYASKVKSDFDAAVKYWSDAVNNLTTEYGAKIDALYGPQGIMQSEFLENGDDNPAYLPMSQAGLALTKNIIAYNNTITQEYTDAQASITTNNGNIYKLTSIKTKLNAIIVAAQKRRDAKRKKDGKTPVTQACITNEQVTYLDSNGDIK